MAAATASAPLATALATLLITLVVAAIILVRNRLTFIAADVFVELVLSRHVYRFGEEPCDE